MAIGGILSSRYIVGILIILLLFEPEFHGIKIIFYGDYSIKKITGCVVSNAS
ncbi:MAG: hypothetical protein ACI9LM_004200 [Alteromonadaceae bacterium]|jgi:hypothetical protein